MPKISLVDDDLKAKMDRLEKRSPTIFRKKMTEFLKGGSQKIKLESLRIARAEATGSTHAYMQGFMISPIMKAVDGELSVKIYNRELYSMVIEYGGKWKRMPPPIAFEHWVRMIFSPASTTEAKQISFAVRKAILDRSKRGRRGQKFIRAKETRGRVYTMNRAMKKSQPQLERWLELKVQEGINEL